MTVNFSMLALDQILNNAAVIPYMSGGQFAIPLVIRMATGGGRRVAAQHSHSLEGWYAHIPGLRVLTPAMIDDARYMLIGALADPKAGGGAPCRSFRPQGDRRRRIDPPRRRRGRGEASRRRAAREEGNRPRRDAQGDRRRNGAFEARNPALLPRRDGRPLSRHGVAGAVQLGASAPGAHPARCVFLKASALALREWPQFNGAYENGAFTAAPAVHVGWAIALRGGGLIASAIRDADQRPLSDLMAAMRDLVERARRGGLRSSELTSPTVTVTNVGDRGAETVTGIIYPPQVALIGFGRAALRPWVVDGRVEPCMLVSLSLAADHRVTDGHIGGLFLASIARRLQEPKSL
jgi:hypothetical protein